MSPPHSFFFFFFNDTATTEIYTLSLHDALPIYGIHGHGVEGRSFHAFRRHQPADYHGWSTSRSEEHTSELQSRLHLVCRLLLEKKKKKKKTKTKQQKKHNNIRLHNQTNIPRLKH